MDIKLEFLPPWLINFISRQLIGLGFKHYQKTLISISNGEGSSKHFQKLIETQPLYRHVKAGLQSKDIKRTLSSIIPRANLPSDLILPDLSEENALAVPRFTISFAASDAVNSSFETLSDATTSWKDSSYEDSTLDDVSSSIDTFDEASSRVHSTFNHSSNKVPALNGTSARLFTLDEDESSNQIGASARHSVQVEEESSDQEVSKDNVEGVDPEVQHALQVLDKIINLVKSQKLRPTDSITAESSELGNANLVASKGSTDLADNEIPIPYKLSNGSGVTGSRNSEQKDTTIPNYQMIEGNTKKNRGGLKMQPRCFPFRRSVSKK